MQLRVLAVRVAKEEAAFPQSHEFRAYIQKMIRVFTSDLIPDYAEFSRRRSISAILNRLLDQDIASVEVVIHEHSAFVSLRERGGSASYLRCSMKEWGIIEHIIRTHPMKCSCWACGWRLIRRRYHDLTAYTHLFHI